MSKEADVRAISKRLQGLSRASTIRPRRNAPAAAPTLGPCHPGALMPYPGSLTTNFPSGVTVMGPLMTQSPMSWSNDHSALFAPGGSASRSPSPSRSSTGRFGNVAGIGTSKLVGIAPPGVDGPVCTVITRGRFNPGGSGPGMRSGGTGAMPTVPPRVPSSAKSALAGTMTFTPANSGNWSSTAGAKVTSVSCSMLTGCSVPG